MPPDETRRQLEGQGTWIVTATPVPFDNLLPQEVRASSLREALAKAAELPLAAWFPTEDDELREAGG